jgi:putative ABC transport system permease protein
MGCRVSNSWQGENEMAGLFHDLRYSLRMLSKTPGFTSVAIITLALGIGANTAMFSMVDGVLMRPLPFKDPQQLYTLWERNLKMGYEQNPPAAGNFRDWRNHSTVFEQLAAFDASRTFNFAGTGTPERVDGATVSSSLFELLGVKPGLGRTFSPEEDQPGRDRVVILGYGLWRRRFNADPSIVGKTVSIDGKDCTVIGVMPAGFQFPGNTGTILDIFTAPAAQLWMPLALTDQQWSERSSHYLQVIARLKPAVTLAQAQTEMNSIEQQLVSAYPKDYIGTDVNFVSLHSQVVGSYRTSLLVLFGAVVAVLLICCANVANLYLAQAASRQKEMAVRFVMGAGRFRLIRQLVTESLLLATVGGALGILLAYWAIRFLKLILPDTLPNADLIHINLPALIFTLVATVATGLLFGLLPAIQASRADLTDSLKKSERGLEGVQHNRLRSLLVVSEVALALVLLVGTGLLLRSFVRLQEVSLGFVPEHVLTMQVSLSEVRYPDPQKAVFFTQLLEKIRALPGVESAGAIGHLPLGGKIESYDLQIEGHAPLPNEYANPDNHVVEPGYFEAMKIALLNGRYFDSRDTANSPPAIIINEAAAHNLFPNENPLGKRLKLGFNNFSGEIVGVVANTKHLTLEYPPVEEVYVSYSQAPFWGTMALTVRTASAPLALAPAVREVVLSIDKDQPVSKIRTMDDVLDGSVSAPRFRTILLALFGVAALFLGAIGIFGLVSYSVTQRTREIGIRMALGAAQPQVMKLALGQGLKLTLIGLAIGLVGSIGVTRLLSSMLYEVRPTDPLTFAGVTLVLAAIALLATYIPARRAVKVDPNVALRYE